MIRRSLAAEHCFAPRSCSSRGRRPLAPARACHDRTLQVPPRQRAGLVRWRPPGAAAPWTDARSRIRPCLESLPGRSGLFDSSAAHGVRGRVQQLRTERPQVHRSVERGLRLGHPLRLASYTRRTLLACDHAAQRGGGRSQSVRAQWYRACGVRLLRVVVVLTDRG